MEKLLGKVKECRKTKICWSVFNIIQIKFILSNMFFILLEWTTYSENSSYIWKYLNGQAIGKISLFLNGYDKQGKVYEFIIKQIEKNLLFWILETYISC